MNLHLSRPQRGSTILLVLAMLSILLLLGLAFSYSGRLETQASYNYARLAQARTAAATGLPMSLTMLRNASQGLTSPLQEWAVVPQALGRASGKGKDSGALSVQEMVAVRNAGLNMRKNQEGHVLEAPQANIQIRDLSGALNINAIPDQARMERVVSAVLPGGDVTRKSATLMALRGDFNRPASSSKRDANNNGATATATPENLDLRDPSASLIDNLARLQYGAKDNRAAFTETEIEKLAEVVTVFSQAPESFNLPNGQSIARIPLDAIEPKLVFDTLRLAFPDKNEALLLQYAANLADFSDDDDEPTILDRDGNVITGIDLNNPAALRNYTIGVEQVPLISEVYPDSLTSLGFADAGQFVEIANPWNRSVSLQGWTIRTSGGGSVTLAATLPANGYLVITDNYNTPAPDSPPSHGSIVSIFGATANGTSQQVMVQAGLELTDRNGYVALHDPAGNLVDWFAYGATGNVDSRQSFQRKDPLVRGTTYAEATPFKSASGASWSSSVSSIITNAWNDGNTTMTKISQLFAVSTGFAEQQAIDAPVATSGGTVHPAQLPELRLSEQTNGQPAANGNGTDPFPNNLDLRLVDVFTATPSFVAPDDTEETEAEQQQRNAYQAFRDKLERVRERNRNRGNNRTVADDDTSTAPQVYSFGKLNLNTCSKYALLGLNLDSVAGSQGSNLPAMVQQFEGHRLRRLQQGQVPFGNVSDFVALFAGQLTPQNAEVLDTLTDQVSVGSSAFEITATNRLSASEQAALDSNSSASGPRPATATAQWVVSVEGDNYSVVNYSIVP